MSILRIQRPVLLRCFSTAALLPALVALVGCGESRVEVFPVSGKVTFQGQPPVGALIVLHPVSPAEGASVAPTGAVKKDGTFAITAYEKGDGAPPGEYVATIEWYKFDEKLGGSGPNVLPQDYANAKTSPIKVTIKAGAPTEIPPITLAAAKGAKKVGMARAPVRR